MKTSIWVILAAGTLISANAQTSINGGRAITGAWDASGAASSKPAKTGASLPATCSQGEQFFLTTAAAGSNLYLCAQANTWTQALSSQASEGANQVLAGPSSGTAQIPAFRNMVKADLPATTVHVDQSNTYTGGTQDLSGAAATLPAQVGSTLPVTCAVGQFYFLTSASPGKNVNICASANTWVTISGGGGGVSGGPISAIGVCNLSASGQIYYPTDSVYALWCDGTTWRYRLNGATVTPADNSTFTAALQSGATMTVKGGASATVGEVVMTVPAGMSTAFKPSLALINNPYGNVWTLTGVFAGQPTPPAYGATGGSIGLAVRTTGGSGSYANATAVLRALYGGSSGGNTLMLQIYDGSYNFLSTASPAESLILGSIFWIRIHADGTNLTSQYSADGGQNWYTISQTAISNLTGGTGSLTQLGWFVSPDNQQYSESGALLHWSLINQ